MILRILSTFLIFTFFLQEFSFASELKPIVWPETPPISSARKLLPEIPESVAVLEEAWVRPGRTVYLVQDAHTNFSAQKNIISILRRLIEKEKIRTVYVEGGFEDVSLTSLKKGSPPALREKVGARYLRTGELSGAEFLNLTSENDFALEGVEDRALYWKSVELYRAVSKQREKLKEYILNLKRSVEALRPEILNPLLRGFDNKRQVFLDGKLSFGEYFAALARYARRFEIPLSDYPELERVASLEQIEKTIDFSAANQEAAEAVRGLDEASWKSEAGSLNVRNSRKAKAFYSFLEERLKGSSAQAHPNLSRYFEYLAKARGLRPAALFDQREAFEKRLVETLIADTDERRLIDIGDRIRQWEAMLDLTLLPDDFQSLSAGTESLRSLTGFLNEKILLLEDHYDRVIFLDEKFEKALETAEEFYALTRKRDEIFVEKMLAHMNIAGETKAILVTGGYHSPNLKAILKKEKVAFVCVTPQVLHETNMKNYEKLLLGQTIAGSGAPDKLSLEAVGSRLANSVSPVGFATLAQDLKVPAAVSVADTRRGARLTGNTIRTKSVVNTVKLVYKVREKGPSIDRNDRLRRRLLGHIRSFEAASEHNLREKVDLGDGVPELRRKLFLVWTFSMALRPPLYPKNGKFRREALIQYFLDNGVSKRFLRKLLRWVAATDWSDHDIRDPFSIGVSEWAPHHMMSDSGDGYNGTKRQDRWAVYWPAFQRDWILLNGKPRALRKTRLSKQGARLAALNELLDQTLKESADQRGAENVIARAAYLMDFLIQRRAEGDSLENLEAALKVKQLAILSRNSDFPPDYNTLDLARLFKNLWQEESLLWRAKTAEAKQQLLSVLEDLRQDLDELHYGPRQADGAAYVLERLIGDQEHSRSVAKEALRLWADALQKDGEDASDLEVVREALKRVHSRQDVREPAGARLARAKKKVEIAKAVDEKERERAVQRAERQYRAILANARQANLRTSMPLTEQHIENALNLLKNKKKPLPLLGELITIVGLDSDGELVELGPLDRALAHLYYDENGSVHASLPGNRPRVRQLMHQTARVFVVHGGEVAFVRPFGEGRNENMDTIGGHIPHGWTAERTVRNELLEEAGFLEQGFSRRHDFKGRWERIPGYFSPDTASKTELITLFIYHVTDDEWEKLKAQNEKLKKLRKKLTAKEFHKNRVKVNKELGSTGSGEVQSVEILPLTGVQEGLAPWRRNVREHMSADLPKVFSRDLQKVLESSDLRNALARAVPEVPEKAGARLAESDRLQIEALMRELAVIAARIEIIKNDLVKNQNPDRRLSASLSVAGQLQLALQALERNLAIRTLGLSSVTGLAMDDSKSLNLRNSTPERALEVIENIREALGEVRRTLVQTYVEPETEPGTAFLYSPFRELDMEIGNALYALDPGLAASRSPVDGQAPVYATGSRLAARSTFSSKVRLGGQSSQIAGQAEVFYKDVQNLLDTLRQTGVVTNELRQAIAQLQERSYIVLSDVFLLATDSESGSLTEAVETLEGMQSEVVLADQLIAGLEDIHAALQTIVERLSEQSVKIASFLVGARLAFPQVVSAAIVITRLGPAPLLYSVSGPYVALFDGSREMAGVDYLSELGPWQQAHSLRERQSRAAAGSRLAAQRTQDDLERLLPAGVGNAQGYTGIDIMEISNQIKNNKDFMALLQFLAVLFEAHGGNYYVDRIDDLESIPYESGLTRRDAWEGVMDRIRMAHISYLQPKDALVTWLNFVNGEKDWKLIKENEALAVRVAGFDQDRLANLQAAFIAAKETLRIFAPYFKKGRIPDSGPEHRDVLDKIAKSALPEVLTQFSVGRSRPQAETIYAYLTGQLNPRLADALVLRPLMEYLDSLAEALEQIRRTVNISA